MAQGVPTAQKLVSRVFSDPVLLSKLAGHINQCKLMPSLARSSQNEFSSLEQVLRRNLETVERIQAEALQRQAAQKKLEQEQAAAERRELEKAAAEAAALEAVRRKQEEDAAAAERKRLDDEAAEQRREEKELEEKKAIRARVDVEFDQIFHVCDGETLPSMNLSSNDAVRLWLVGFKSHDRGPKKLGIGRLCARVYGSWCNS